MMSNLALYAISAALFAGGPSDLPRDDVSIQPRDESSATASQAQASPDEAQPVRAAQDDSSSSVTHVRSAMPAEKSAAAPASKLDLGVTDAYLSQQQIWTAP